MSIRQPQSMQQDENHIVGRPPPYELHFWGDGLAPLSPIPLLIHAFFSFCFTATGAAELGRIEPAYWDDPILTQCSMAIIWFFIQVASQFIAQIALIRYECPWAILCVLITATVSGYLGLIHNAILVHLPSANEEAEDLLPPFFLTIIANVPLLLYCMYSCVGSLVPPAHNANQCALSCSRMTGPAKSTVEYMKQDCEVDYSELSIKQKLSSSPD
ncbi:hypothetical protein JX265_007427 [Neoarthrinium moseri]|uniref:Uncharacterized protein n=1 Tax=Neoarthrinium moseri TaxID=1658444 RepID=A0A9P9WKG5_9PEZI|nr:uncharacterized protein JN550_009150 [Neoarthrinium moseri]KAI1843641.1 hypothetical protein JX266_010274 [Neoarthrinium moseri]KAI1864130.1 hypothetical protein JN550_009150 [Neoarthrinium moseri]KAI1867625.1 hypothetical protein JX265_007427 [Neoarthrinium moseri]